MAVYREHPKCEKCGETINAITRKDNSQNPVVGDNFIRWDYEGHKCFEEPKFEKVKCTCMCHNSGGFIKHCIPCCNNGFIEIPVL